MSRRKICVISGSRAEYGLLYWLMQEIKNDKDLHLQIIATGMHLAPTYGLTYKQIEADGFTINEKVDMLLTDNSAVGVVKSMGLALSGFADALSRLNPDIIVVLGDRFEILTAAQAALILGIPLTHLHGGELTAGAYDESIRHAITKMAQLHFVAAEEYRRRIIQMGEHPTRVYNFGAPGLDYINRLEPHPRAQLEKELQVTLKAPLFLVTYHPTTLVKQDPQILTEELQGALEKFPNATIIITAANADQGGRMINQSLQRYAEDKPGTYWFPSLGQVKYLSLMYLADVMIGNSSSGIIEAPALKKATVNIGIRQQGRLRAKSVIDCHENRDAIADAIHTALSEEFQEYIKDTQSLYGSGNCAKQIKEILKSVKLEDLVLKHFFDLQFDL
ncbi:MAG: UDP-N-acetylglucosamine 2-epimerase [Methylocystaceae bacterium]